MNSEIRAAVERLLSACIELTLDGKYHAHMSYSAHVGEVEVRVCSAFVDYQGRDYDYLLNDEIYIHHAFLTDQDVVAQVVALTKRVIAYRSKEAA